MGWAELEDEMSDHCSSEYAEQVVHVPMIKAPNARPAEDVDRPAYETRAIFEWPSILVDLLKGQDKSRVPQAAFHASRQPTASFDKRELEQTLKEGDLIVLIARDLTFEVLSPKPDGQGRIMCELTQRGSHTP